LTAVAGSAGSRDQASIEVRAKLSMILASWLFKRSESHK